MKIETMAIHAGNTNDDWVKSVIPPIYLSTTFDREADGSYIGDYHYSLKGNPNRTALERCLAILENGKFCAAFGSGSAAIATAVRGSVRPGDHIIIPDDVFQGTTRILENTLKIWGIIY